MKATGITRKVDELGRIVIPMDIRTKLNINPKDSIDICQEGNSIILKKTDESCILCGNRINLIRYNNNLICKNCIKNINSLN